MSEEARADIQKQLVRVIVRLLARHRGIHYYQGFHDIVVTFLLVLGEDLTYLIMGQLITCHIKYVSTYGGRGECNVFFSMSCLSFGLGQ